MQVAVRAFSRAWANTGKRIAARMAMIAITTRSSIKVKPARQSEARDLNMLPPMAKAAVSDRRNRRSRVTPLFAIRSGGSFFPACALSAIRTGPKRTRKHDVLLHFALSRSLPSLPGPSRPVGGRSVQIVHTLHGGQELTDVRR